MAFSNHDLVSDSPTNNFATLNPLDTYNSPALSNGNLDVSVTSTANRFVGATLRITSGKWYFEYINRQSLTSTNNTIGLTPVNAVNASQAGSSYPGFVLNATSITMGDTVSNSLARIGTGSGATDTDLGWKWGVNDVVNVAVDFDNKKVWFGRNGVWYNSGSPASGTNATLTINSAVESMQPFDVAFHVGSWNFGQDPTFAGNKNTPATVNGVTGPFAPSGDAAGTAGLFYYPPPAGFKSLCTANLPDFTPDVDGDTPQEYFKAVIWTGNGTGTSRTIDIGIEADLVWSKRRSADASHTLVYDSVRGAAKDLKTSLTSSEEINHTNGYISSSLGSNSITYTDGSSTNFPRHNYNDNGIDYVVWCWKAGGTGVTNNDGSITSTVSANTDAGFSIVSWNGNGASAGATVGHGLNSAPELILPKNRDAIGSWHCYHSALGGTKGIILDSPNNASTDPGFWNNTDPTDSVFTVGTYNVFNDDYIAYCWHSVEGYSKFGSYTGNGSPDGPFVYTGFRVGWIMLKNVTTSGVFWMITDSERSPYNPADRVLHPNSPNAEGVNAVLSIDILSNGFKVRNNNNSHNTANNTYIYMALAEQPFNYANAR